MHQRGVDRIEIVSASDECGGFLTLLSCRMTVQIVQRLLGRVEIKNVRYILNKTMK
jgi:hypothetical protein